MVKNGKYITSLSSEEALDFIMQSDQFHNFELLEYFDFTTVLQHVHSKVGSSAIIIFGLMSSARAIAMRCCSPPESSLGIL